MKTRSMAAAFAVAALLTGLGVTTASAAPPSKIEIRIAPTIPSDCNYSCGMWTASGSINDHGSYIRTEIASSPPGRSFFELGPFRETFVLTSRSGSFTIKAEEKSTALFVSEGVFQLLAGTGAYVSASGHGDAASVPNQPVLSLTGVAKTG
jgi:hypothetical protein